MDRCNHSHSKNETGALLRQAVGVVSALPTPLNGVLPVFRSNQALALMASAQAAIKNRAFHLMLIDDDTASGVDMTFLFGCSVDCCVYFVIVESKPRLAAY